jgi:hypothetical protein
MRAEVVLLVVFVVVAAAAFGLESAGPDVARIVGIGFCLLLVSLLVVGMVFRRNRKRRLHREQVARENGGE